MKPRWRAGALVLGAAAAIACSGAAAGATFYYDSYGGFLPGTASPAGSGTFVNDPDTATGGGPYDVGANTDPRMPPGSTKDVVWGTASSSVGPYSGRSGLALTKVDDGAVVVDGAQEVFGTLTHFNRPIGVGTDLDFVRLSWSLQLFDSLAAASTNAGAFKTIDLGFTVYNWETPNDPAANPAYVVSYDNGATWTTIGPGVCPGSTPVGTLIVGHLGKIYRSAHPDDPANPVWDGQCADAHVYEGDPGNVYAFARGGRDYRLELSGFYGRTGQLTDTFWACEDQACWGTVKFAIRDVTAPTDVPVLSDAALAAMALLLAASGAALASRGRGARR